jgi:hypothetical protein
MPASVPADEGTYAVVMDSDAFVRRMLDGWKRTRPRDWSGQQKTLGEMFSTQKKIKYGDGEHKSRLWSSVRR